MQLGSRSHSEGRNIVLAMTGFWNNKYDYLHTKLKTSAGFFGWQLIYVALARAHVPELSTVLVTSAIQNLLNWDLKVMPRIVGYSIAQPQCFRVSRLATIFGTW
jgi:hypothetical protein